jgi:hypothetical protein
MSVKGILFDFVIFAMGKVKCGLEKKWVKNILSFFYDFLNLKKFKIEKLVKNLLSLNFLI